MSRIHRVINLKEPFKLFGMTLGQIGISALGLIIAFAVGTKIPGDWKVGNLPAGFVVGLTLFCLSLVAGRMTELKPIVWWRASLFSALGLSPKLFLPRPEPGAIYPDPTITEHAQAEEFYIDRSR